MSAIDPDRPAVFIGHGPLTADQKQSLQAIVDHLEKKGYQVLIDSEGPEMRAGEEFRESVHRWLHDCQAGILLLTPAGIVDSDWLPGEALLLSNRMHVETEFILITVFGEGARPEQIRNGRWNPPRLDGLEALFYEDPELLTKLVRRLDILHVRRRALMEPLGNLITFLTSSLGQIDPILARRVLATLGHQPDGVRRTDLALHVTVQLLDTRDLDKLGEAVVALVPYSLIVAEDVLEICLPFTWLEEKIATALQKAYSEQSAAAARTKSDITWKMLVMRASAKQPPWPICVIPNHVGDNPPQDLLEAARRALSSLYWPSEERVSDDELRQEIEYNPCALVIPPPMPDTATLVPLRATFPAATLLFSDVAPDEVANLGYNDIIYLDTLPSWEVEKSVLDKHRRVRRELESMHRRSGNDRGR